MEATTANAIPSVSGQGATPAQGDPVTAFSDSLAAAATQLIQPQEASKLVMTAGADRSDGSTSTSSSQEAGPADQNSSSLLSPAQPSVTANGPVPSSITAASTTTVPANIFWSLSSTSQAVAATMPASPAGPLKAVQSAVTPIAPKSTSAERLSSEDSVPRKKNAKGDSTSQTMQTGNSAAAVPVQSAPSSHVLQMYSFAQSLTALPATAPQTSTTGENGFTAQVAPAALTSAADDSAPALKPNPMSSAPATTLTALQGGLTQTTSVQSTVLPSAVLTQASDVPQAAPQVVTPNVQVSSVEAPAMLPHAASMQQPVSQPRTTAPQPAPTAPVSNDQKSFSVSTTAVTDDQTVSSVSTTPVTDETASSVSATPGSGDQTVSAVRAASDSDGQDSGIAFAASDGDDHTSANVPPVSDVVKSDKSAEVVGSAQAAIQAQPGGEVPVDLSIDATPSIADTAAPQAGDVVTATSTATSTTVPGSAQAVAMTLVPQAFVPTDFANHVAQTATALHATSNPSTTGPQSVGQPTKLSAAAHDTTAATPDFNATSHAVIAPATPVVPVGQHPDKSAPSVASAPASASTTDGHSTSSPTVHLSQAARADAGPAASTADALSSFSASAPGVGANATLPPSDLKSQTIIPGDANVNFSSAVTASTSRSLQAAATSVKTTRSSSKETSEPQGQANGVAGQSAAQAEGNSKSSADDHSAHADTTQDQTAANETTHALAADGHAQSVPVSSNPHAATSPAGGERVPSSRDQQAATISSAQATDAQSSVSSARLLQSLGQSEMRVGLHSAEFGNISISTSTTHDSLSAQISLDHADLARTLTAHLPEMQARLGNSPSIDVRLNNGQSASGQGSGTGNSNMGSTADSGTNGSRGGRQPSANQSAYSNTFSNGSGLFVPAAANTNSDRSLAGRLDLQA